MFQTSGFMSKCFTLVSGGDHTQRSGFAIGVAGKLGAGDFGESQIFEAVMGCKIVESGETVFELDLFSTKVCWNLAPRISIPLEDGISIVINLQPSQCPFYQIKYFLTTLISV